MATRTPRDIERLLAPGQAVTLAGVADGELTTRVIRWDGPEVLLDAPRARDARVVAPWPGRTALEWVDDHGHAWVWTADLRIVGRPVPIVAARLHGPGDRQALRREARVAAHWPGRLVVRHPWGHAVYRSVLRDAAPSAVRCFLALPPDPGQCVEARWETPLGPVEGRMRIWRVDSAPSRYRDRVGRDGVAGWDPPLDDAAAARWAAALAMAPPI